MNIALITASSTPVPAVRGGATQTMMTHLVDVNDTIGEHQFIIFSYFDEEALTASKKYKHTTFHYYKPQGAMEKIYSFIFRAMRKITFGHTYIRSFYIKWCAEIINKSDIDVVILEGNCFQTLQMRRLIKKKIILHMHIDRLNVTLDNGRNIINACSAVWGISDFCRKRMLEVDSSAADKLYVLKNTVDVDKFVPGDKVKLRNKLHEKLGIANDVKVVSYCGRITQDKGVMELVKATALLNDEKIFLLIIGSSVYRDGVKTKYVEQLEQEVKKLKGGHSFTGYISQKELPEYTSAVELVVVPSLCNEAAGNVIIEALACGTPVVASTQGGIPEYADLSACELVDVNEKFVDNLSKKMKLMLSDPALYQDKQSHARSIALQYSKQNYYKNFIELTLKAIKS